MELTYFIPLFSAVIYIILSVVTILNRPLSHQHKLFLTVLVSAACWSISDFLLRSPLFEQDKITVFRMNIITSLFWVTQFYYFCRVFLNLPKDIALYSGYVTLTIMAALCIFGLIPSGVQVANGVVHPIYGLWVVLWVAPMILFAVMGVMALAKKLRNPLSPEDRNKIGYLISAIVAFAILGIPSVTALAYNIPLASIGGVLCATILAFAVVRHDLISISIFLRRLLGWVSLFIAVVSVYEIIQVIGHFAIGIELTAFNIIISTLGALTGTAMLFWLRPIFLEKIDRLFFRQRYQHRRDLLDFVAHKIRGVLGLQELGEGLLPPLAKALDCQQVFILLPEKDQASFTTRFAEPSDEASAFSIQNSSLIIKYLHNQYLTRKDLDIRPEFRGIWTNEREAINAANIELLFPLLNRGNLVGILAIGRKRSGKYSVEDTNLVESIANQVAVSLEKEHFQSELANREKELSIINQLTRLLTSSLNIQDVYDSFILELRETIDIDIATIGVIENDSLYFSAVYGKERLPWNTGDKLELRRSGIEWLVLDKKTLVYDNLLDSGKGSLVDQYIELGTKSLVVLPLITKDEVIGVLTLASKREKAYGRDRLRLLQQLASQISTSIVNAQLYSSAEKRARVDELTGVSNRRHFDETIDKETQRHLRYGSMFSLVIMDIDQFKDYNDLMGHPKGDRLLKKVGQLIKREARNVDMTFRYGGDEFAMILPSTSVKDGVEIAERIRQAVERETRNENIPISVSLGVAGWPNDGITAQDLITAADQALYHAKLTGKNRVCTATQMLPKSIEEIGKGQGHKERPIEQETLNAIYALAATIEARDLYTYGHSRKVRTLSVNLAEALGLPADKVAVVSHAALLHDIGKIGIYDTVLNKPDILTNEERDIIKMHPELSRAIVAHIPDLTPCLPAILHHHERWDGKGYPTGLKGENIPIEARILTIADSFDAMTSARPYRKPLPNEEVINELKRCSGTQFDPKLVEVFLPIAYQALNLPLSESSKEIVLVQDEALELT